MKKETSATRLRRNKEYYLNELKNNARRCRTRNYERDGELHKKRRTLSGSFNRRKWTLEEVEYLKENRFSDYLIIALKLKRSLGSIEHKIVKLNLQKNHKWKGGDKNERKYIFYI